MDIVLCTFLDIVLIISGTLTLQSTDQVYSLLPSSQSSYFYYSLKIHNSKYCRKPK